MFKYSFMSRYSTNTREEVEDFLNEVPKPILYTHGLGYRHPTIYKKLIRVDEAFDIINKNSCFDLEEYEDYVHLNTYSDNDLW